jgi:hypothetical protein
MLLATFPISLIFSKIIQDLSYTLLFSLLMMKTKVLALEEVYSRAGPERRWW